MKTNTYYPVMCEYSKIALRDVMNLYAKTGIEFIVLCGIAHAVKCSCDYEKSYHSDHSEYKNEVSSSVSEYVFKPESSSSSSSAAPAFNELNTNEPSVQKQIVPFKKRVLSEGSSSKRRKSSEVFDLPEMPGLNDAIKLPELSKLPSPDKKSLESLKDLPDPPKRHKIRELDKPRKHVKKVRIPSPPREMRHKVVKTIKILALDAREGSEMRKPVESIRKIIGEKYPYEYIFDYTITNIRKRDMPNNYFLAFKFNDSDFPINYIGKPTLGIIDDDGTEEIEQLSDCKVSLAYDYSKNKFVKSDKEMIKILKPLIGKN
jgi:hypothetical protein